MPMMRKLTIVAQDPSVGGRAPGRGMLTTQVEIPHEKLDKGPRGYRVHVVDYDASERVLYEPAVLDAGDGDRFADKPQAALLDDPAFHAQNVYAIMMRVLSRVEFALGRRVSWGFGGHQIHAAPHAFADANAYYSEEDHGLYFGYFPGRGGKTVYTCLSHDVIAHETTHALLDGLRDSYTLPSHPDQAGFHEGFADIVALLSVFGLKDVVGFLLAKSGGNGTQIAKLAVTGKALRGSALLGLAEEFGQETSDFRESALRRAVAGLPRDTALEDPGYEECHVRGEILSGAVLNAFVEVWRKRLEGWLPRIDKTVSRDHVAEDGGEAAEHLLTMVVRALDYCPAVDITFGDFLSALLTADMELLPDDGKYRYRDALRAAFAAWGIAHASTGREHPDAGQILEAGAWERPKYIDSLSYDSVHPESLRRDPDEVFRFLWENREQLGVYPDVYTRVMSVRPCLRVGPDGFFIRETVSEYMQLLDLEAGGLAGMGIEKPKDMPDTTPVRLHGGGVLVFDEFSRLKYHVRSRLDSQQRQAKRLAYLWRNGIKDQRGRYGFSDGAPAGQRFALMHLRRAGRLRGEEWHD